MDDIVATCLTCGAYSLTRKPEDIPHYSGCGGVAEVEKWDKYYSDPEWEKAVLGEDE